ncbi:hypothetical protein EDC01DRAFT_293957 [Geopyxis carbonaria]|nr:hypothetical protein EDC01DRAFT_293957 [Geopyxis carbonaria]
MATAAQDQSSIPLPEIPVRLRCTICQGLLRGAVRLPCCEQAICENCRANLPTVCPVCDHSPLSSDDCHPNSTLRTTVAVFLKTAEKKHALALQKEERERLQKLQQQQPAASPAPTSVQPVQEVKAPAPQPAAAQSPVASVAQAASPPASNATGAPVIEAQITNEENREVANADQETEEQEQQQHQNVDGQISAEGQAPTQQMNPAQQQMGYQQNGWYNGQQMNMAQQQQMFPGQDFSQWGAYNPMIAMGGWNNGYGANNMMGFNMMDPMVMSQVGYGGGEFGGMGGNGGMGMGWNGWNGQGNMGYGQSMGMRNGGYYAGSGGYNHQSQANHQVPHQQYQNPHVHRQQNFSRGGGFVAGGPQRNAGPYGNPNAPNQQNINANQTAVASDTPAHNFSTQLQGIDDAVAAVKQPTSEAPGEGISSASADDESTAIVLIDSSSADRKEVPPTAATTDTPASADGTSQIPTVGHSDVANMQATFPDDYNQGMMMMNNNMNTHYGGFARGRGGFRGNPGFRGGMRGGHISPPIGPNPGLGKGVEGAPAAPKAMREGRPNRGMINRGAFGGMGRGNFGGPISVINTGGSRPRYLTLLLLLLLSLSSSLSLTL